ncbi:MAG: twin-arginine translocation pathway signal protein, partial [Pseudomonadota bacterium]
EEMVETGSAAYQTGKDINDEMLNSTQGYGWLISADNSRSAQLESGMHWVRINQAATMLGLAMHPVSQILQEFPEMADLSREFHALVGVEQPARVQGLFRLGYGPATPPSPRWPLESHLVDA